MYNPVCLRISVYHASHKPIHRQDRQSVPCALLEHGHLVTLLEMPYVRHVLLAKELQQGIPVARVQPARFQTLLTLLIHSLLVYRILVHHALQERKVALVRVYVVQLDAQMVNMPLVPPVFRAL